MKLYHGTNTDIEHIDFTISKVGKDFGVGFYLTPDLDSAKRQAKRRADIEGGTPIVLTYEFNDSVLNGEELKTISFERYTIEWAMFVKKNRANKTRNQAHDYDIVVGPIADDDIGMQMRRFNAGIITIDEFLENLKYKHIVLQYFFGTQNAIKTFTEIMNDELFAIEDITVALATRLMEEKGMDMIEALDAIYNSDTFAKVVDKSTGLMCQSDAYIYDYLNHEIETGKMG